jgi:hypothetical protein
MMFFLNVLFYYKLLDYLTCQVIQKLLELAIVFGLINPTTVGK